MAYANSATRHSNRITYQAATRRLMIVATRAAVTVPVVIQAHTDATADCRYAGITTGVRFASQKTKRTTETAAKKTANKSNIEPASGALTELSLALLTDHRQMFGSHGSSRGVFSTARSIKKGIRLSLCRRLGVTCMRIPGKCPLRRQYVLCQNARTLAWIRSAQAPERLVVIRL
jgi:hypothetical protein